MYRFKGIKIVVVLWLSLMIAHHAIAGGTNNSKLDTIINARALPQNDAVFVEDFKRTLTLSVDLINFFASNGYANFNLFFTPKLVFVFSYSNKLYGGINVLANAKNKPMTNDRNTMYAAGFMYFPTFNHSKTHSPFFAQAQVTKGNDDLLVNSKFVNNQQTYEYEKFNFYGYTFDIGYRNIQDRGFYSSVNTGFGFTRYVKTTSYMYYPRIGFEVGYCF